MRHWTKPQHSLGILRKIDYFAFYEELYGKSDKIRSALLDQSINILKANQSNTSYDMRDYKITLMESLNKHGLLNHPKGVRVLEQAIEDSYVGVRLRAVGAAGEIGEVALPILEKGMKDSQLNVRWKAVGAAREIGEAAFHIVEQGVEDSHAAVHLLAVEVAKEIGKTYPSLLRRLLEKEDLPRDTRRRLEELLVK